MEYTIKNEKMSVTVSSRGGEFRSVKDASGKEYLWQGDIKTWPDRGLNLFPYVGRMTDKSYLYRGKKYHMDIHGFLPTSEMTLVSQKEDQLTLRLESSEDTLAQYPFRFCLDIIWRLEGNTVNITYQVKNTDEKTMYFGVGGHPGFQVPVEEGLEFEDYRIDFGEGALPRRILFSEDCFVLEKDEPLELEDGRYLKLYHNLFDDDAVVLKNLPDSVTLSSKKGKKFIHVAFPDMDYLGIWHWPHAEVPYVCIEPWSSLPSRKDIVEDIEKQPGMQSVKSGDIYRNSWSITLEEK